MSVNVGDRNESKVEFDNTYFKIHDDEAFIDYDEKLYGRFDKDANYRIIGIAGGI